MLLSGEWTRNGLNVSTRRIEQQRVGKKQHNDTNIRVHTLEYLPKDVGFVCWCLKMFCVCGQSKNVCGGVDFLSKPADEKHTRRKHDRFKSIWPRRCGFSKKKKRFSTHSQHHPTTVVSCTAHERLQPYTFCLTNWTHILGAASWLRSQPARPFLFFFALPSGDFKTSSGQLYNFLHRFLDGVSCSIWRKTKVSLIFPTVCRSCVLKVSLLSTTSVHKHTHTHCMCAC